MFLIQNAVSVFAASAFERYIKEAVKVRTGVSPQKNINGVADADRFLKDGFSLSLGPILKERAKRLDFLISFRHIAIHNANIRDQRFLRRHGRLFGLEAAQRWRVNRRVDLDPMKVESLLENLISCVDSIHGEVLRILRS